MNESAAAKFNKICVESSGKGRIEFLVNKYPFAYEAAIERKKNEFQLALDFPIVGEKRLSINLDPRIAAKNVNHSSMVRMLESAIGERDDRQTIINAVEEFYVLTSEFVQYRALGKFPNIYKISDTNGHFILTREHGAFVYEIDSYALSDLFFERVVIRISPKPLRENGTILTLFLVPDACEK